MQHTGLNKIHISMVHREPIGSLVHSNAMSDLNNGNDAVLTSHGCPDACDKKEPPEWSMIYF
jgi:hypothetical protein